LHLCSAGPLPIRAAAPSYNAEAHHQLQTNSLITHKQPKLLIFTRSPLHEFEDQRSPWKVLKVGLSRDGKKSKKSTQQDSNSQKVKKGQRGRFSLMGYLEPKWLR